MKIDTIAAKSSFIIRAYQITLDQMRGNSKSKKEIFQYRFQTTLIQGGKNENCNVNG